MVVAHHQRVHRAQRVIDASAEHQQQRAVGELARLQPHHEGAQNRRDQQERIRARRARGLA